MEYVNKARELRVLDPEVSAKERGDVQKTTKLSDCYALN
jgi:hypothetical protein